MSKQNPFTRSVNRFCDGCQIGCENDCNDKSTCCDDKDNRPYRHLSLLPNITKQKTVEVKKILCFYRIFLSLCRKSGLKTCGFLHFIVFLFYRRFLTHRIYMKLVLHPSHCRIFDKIKTAGVAAGRCKRTRIKSPSLVKWTGVRSPNSLTYSAFAILFFEQRGISSIPSTVIISSTFL